MSGWELWTRVAIAVLEVGSVAVFAWFLVDVVALARRKRRGGDAAHPETPPDSPPETRPGG